MTLDQAGVLRAQDNSLFALSPSMSDGGILPKSFRNVNTGPFPTDYLLA